VIGSLSGKAKVLVRDRGLVWVPAERLAKALDVDPSTVANLIGAGNLWLEAGSRAGNPNDDISIFSDGFESGNTERWAPQDDATDARPGIAWLPAAGDSGLYFFGEPIDSIYTSDNVYWLGIGHGRKMTSRDAWVDEVAGEGSFVENLHFEEDAWPLTSVMTDPEADFWMWDHFFPAEGQPVVRKSFVLTAPDVAPSGGSAILTANLQGSFRAPIPLNHRVELRVNGTQLGGIFSWSGHDAYRLEVKFPQSLLVAGDNTVELTALLADGLDFDEFYLESFDLGYRRRLRAFEDRLLAATSGQAVVAVSGFSTPDISVFDLRDPRRPVVLEHVNIVAGDDGFVVSFATGGAAFPFLATTAGAALSTSGIVADVASNLKDPGNRGRWVVIAGPGLEGAAASLATYREQQGLPSVVAPIDDIYDEFNGGIASPWAIRDFLQHASQHWDVPPQYVFLAGDGTLDYKDVWGAGENLIPAPMTVANGGLVPSDNLLADWSGGDGVPEVAIGRLPAHSAAELAVYRDKVINFEAGSGGWKRRVLWLADAADEGGEFPDDLQYLVDGMPTTYTNERIVVDWLGVDDARLRALESWDDGALMVQFLGHGALDFIANHGLVTTDDVDKMANGERTPFLAALTCMVGRFDIPDYDILSEALLLEESGGSIGVWSPSAFSMNEDSALLGRHQVEAIAGGEYATIGDSVRAALNAYVASGTGNPDLPRIFIFLGDPAVRVDW
jgi:hypothetical protein